MQKFQAAGKNAGFFRRPGRELLWGDVGGNAEKRRRKAQVLGITPTPPCPELRSTKFGQKRHGRVPKNTGKRL